MNNHQNAQFCPGCRQIVKALFILGLSLIETAKGKLRALSHGKINKLRRIAQIILVG